MTVSASIANEDGSTVKSRLLHLLKEKRMTQTEFARQLGVSPTYIGAMRRSIPDVKLRKVMEIFPDLNRDWLLYGEGEMLLDTDEDETLILCRSFPSRLSPAISNIGRPAWNCATARKLYPR